MLINAGVTGVVFKRGYPDQLSLQMLEEAGVECIQFPQSEDV